MSFDFRNFNIINRNHVYGTNSVNETANRFYDILFDGCSYHIPMKVSLIIMISLVRSRVQNPGLNMARCEEFDQKSNQMAHFYWWSIRPCEVTEINDDDEFSFIIYYHTIINLTEKATITLQAIVLTYCHFCGN